MIGDDAGVSLWVGAHLGVTFGPCTAIGIALGGKPIAGIVYSLFNGVNLEMSIASTDPRWCTRGTLFAVFAYPFLQLGCRRVTATVAVGNTRARRLVERLGFAREGYHPHAVPAGDAVSYGMLKETCRWIEGARNE